MSSTGTEDLIWLLEQHGFGNYVSDAEVGGAPGNIFKGSKAIIPAGDGPFISIIETGGPVPEGTHNAGPGAYRKPSHKFIVRATDYDTAAARASELFEFFVNWPDNQTINGTYWRSIRVSNGAPFDLQPDEVNRPRITFDINSVKRP